MDRFIVRAIDEARAGGIEQGVQHAAEFTIELSEAGGVARRASLQVLVGARRIAGGDRGQQRAFAERRAEVVTLLGKEVAQHRGVAHQAGDHEGIATAIFGADQIGMALGQFCIFKRPDETTGAHQIVVDEVCLGEAAAELGEDLLHLRIGGRGPVGQRERERRDAVGEAELGALDHGGERQAHQADDRRRAAGFAHCFGEDQRDAAKHRVSDSIAFARRAEDVEVGQAAVHQIGDGAAEHGLVERAVLGPGQADSAENGARKAAHDANSIAIRSTST